MLGSGAKWGQLYKQWSVFFPSLLCSFPREDNSLSVAMLGTQMLKEAMKLLFGKPTFASLPPRVGLLVFSHDTYILF